VIDVKRVYLAPFTAEAVVSRFYDTGNVFVHLWSATDRHYYYTLLQETQLDSPRATDALEVVTHSLIALIINSFVNTLIRQPC